MRKRVSVLGATGSVGRSTLDLVRHAPDKFEIVSLTANRNVEALAEHAVEFGAKVAVIADPAQYSALQQALAGSSVTAMAGPDALCEAAAMDTDYVMAAIVGAVGLEPTLAAVRAGHCVAFANKECLVSAGALMMREVKEHGATFLPVDSEHNAIFQVFETENVNRIARLIMTASGGPFRTWRAEDMAHATPEQAVAHPNWSMGAKISVDSATMMNKGLEVIEAAHLFNMPSEKIDVLVHPQSVIHSMVEYVDGSILAQLGPPDMRVPIASTLAYPDRMNAPVEKVDFLALKRLDFEAPDPDRFPALRLARDALNAGPHAPPILNAANEVAVAAFLSGQMAFADIVPLVERVMTQMPDQAVSSLEDVYHLDAEARRIASETCTAFAV